MRRQRSAIEKYRSSCVITNTAFPRAFKSGNNSVKHLAEERILIGCPLVEQIEWTVFHVGRQQGEPFTLSLREGLRRKQSSSILTLDSSCNRSR